MLDGTYLSTTIQDLLSKVDTSNPTSADNSKMDPHLTDAPSTNDIHYDDTDSDGEDEDNGAIRESHGSVFLACTSGMSNSLSHICWAYSSFTASGFP